MTTAQSTPEREQTEPPERAAGREGLGTFDSLKLHNFRLLLIGTTLSNAAQWIQQVTLGWLVFDLTGSGAMLGTMNVVRSIATVGLAPFSGYAIDRFSRRTLMLAINAWLLAGSTVLGLLMLAGHREVWFLFVFALYGGIGQTLDMPLRQTVVFVLVPRQLASNAVALIQTGWSIMRSAGPFAAGFLILWLGAGGNFLIQAALYALIAFNTLRITFPPNQASTMRRSVMGNVREGLVYVASQPVTRAFLVMGWMLPLLIVPVYVSLSPIYAKNVFHGGPEVLGLLVGCVGVGGIAGGLFTASISRVDRRGLVQIAALFLTALSLVGFALSADLWLAVFFLTLSGFFELIFLTGNQTLLQLSIPDELRGRITSITTLSAGLAPLGAFSAGAGSDLIGPRAITLILSGIAAAIAVVVYLFVPVVRDYRMSKAIAR